METQYQNKNLRLPGAFFQVHIKWDHRTWAGVMLQITAVFALPPRAGCRILVNLLSRYGTWPLFIRCSYQNSKGRLSKKKLMSLSKILSICFKQLEGRERLQCLLKHLIKTLDSRYMNKKINVSMLHAKWNDWTQQYLYDLNDCIMLYTKRYWSRPLFFNPFTQFVDYSPKGHQTLINVSALLQSGPLGSCLGDTLRPSEVN